MLGTLIGGVAALWSPAVVGAAAVTLPITGAFGLEFDQPAPAELIGASIGNPPYPLPPDNLPQSEIEGSASTPGGWHYFAPAAVPEMLDDPATEFRVLLDGVGQPVRIEAQRPSIDCDAAFGWVTDSLTRKYATAQDPTIQPRIGFSRGARFIRDERQVDVACGRGMLIEYVDGAAFDRWRASAQSALAAHQAEQFKVERVAKQIARQQRLRFADAFTIGDKFRLDGALGVVFGETFDAPADYPADTPGPVSLAKLPHPFDAASIELTLSPDRMPIRLEAKLADGNGALFAQVSEALHTKYGTPMKDGSRHKIHKVNGNFFIVRRLERLGELDLVVIDQRADNARKARSEAQAKREFEEATKGL